MEGDVFVLDHGPLGRENRLTVLAEMLGDWKRIDSRETFNVYCREVCRAWAELYGTTGRSERFRELLARIEGGGDNVIPTAWGGVVVTLHEHPRVEKYLVVQRGGYLALEKHEQKDERLTVEEGVGLLLSQADAGGPLAVRAVVPGNQFHFAPGQAHCLIGADNLLVFERSTDPKGMDRDLIFIYEPDGS